MIQQHINRSRQTKAGMSTSFVLHAALLALLTVMAGARVAATGDFNEELTEIAYIEARYGEDVAAKVKLKETPRRPEPPGRGVATDSAVKPAEPAARAELPRTETVRQKMAVADIAAPAIEPAARKPQELAQAAGLEAKAPRPRTRQIIDASKLQGSHNVEISDNVGTPVRANTRPKGDFKPQNGALKSRAGGIVTGGEVVASTRTAGSAAVAEAPAVGAAGGALQSASRGTYAAPKSSLAPAGGSGARTGGTGVVDVAGPTGGGSSEGGRRTILDYGSGGGGRGGGLAGRGRIAEPAPTTDIVTKVAEAAEPQQAVAEVKLDGKGVGMTISGQISGRKILKSVTPEYTSLARRKGWEGVVAVHFTVLADGRVKDNTYLEQSSVHRDLNRMALDAIRKFRFAPLPADQAAVEQWGVITVVFRLN